MSIKSKINSLYIGRLAQAFRCTLSVAAVGLLTVSSFANASEATQSAIRVNLDEAGVLSGRVVTMLDSEESPVVARVSLTSGGKTVATCTTDVVGKFSFKDVEPGEYKMVGVSGEYVGGQSIVVGTEVKEGRNEIQLTVSTAATTSVTPFVNAPMSSYSAAAIDRGTGSFCNAGYSGVDGGIVGGSSLRCLLLIGGAVAIPVALSGDDAAASPDN